MDEQKNKHSHGFTWGMIVGGAVVLMLTTKRGRQILKEVTEGGIDGLDQYLDIDKIKALTSEFDDEDIEEEEKPVSSVKKSEKPAHPIQEIETTEVSQTPQIVIEDSVKKIVISTETKSAVKKDKEEKITKKRLFKRKKK